MARGEIGTTGAGHETDGDQPAGRRRAWPRFLPLAILLAGALIGWTVFGDFLSLETLAQYRESLIAWRDEHLFLAILGYLLFYVAAVAFSVPGAIWLTLAGGFLFGTVLAACLTIVAATAGATLLFLAARSSLGAALRRRAGPWLARLDRKMTGNEAGFLLAMRLVPVFPFFVVNLIPAFLPVRPWTFVWTTLVGIAPATVIISAVGAGLGEVLDRGGKPDLGILFEPQIFGPLLGLAILAVLPGILQRKRGASPQEAGSERSSARADHGEDGR